MDKQNRQIVFGIVLLALSTLFYFIHYLLFHDSHHIFIYLIGDIAFVFIEVLLVTIIIHRLLEAKEKASRIEKLNMVIGAFFSEVGTKLLQMLSSYDNEADKLQGNISGIEGEPNDKYLKVREYITSHKHDLSTGKVDWNDLKTLLAGKRAFLLRLLENPNLLEHESFTDVLWAVFHLTEELEARDTLQELPDSDYKHLAGDIRRVYDQLVSQWLSYMEHLRTSYPYLFSLALRTNPFNPDASPIVKES